MRQFQSCAFSVKHLRHKDVLTAHKTERGSKTVVGSHTQVHIIGIEVVRVIVATHRRIA